MKNLHKRKNDWYVRKIHQGTLYHTSFSFKICGGIRKARAAAEYFLNHLNSLLDDTKAPIRQEFIDAVKRRALSSLYGCKETDNTTGTVCCPYCSRRLPDRSEEMVVPQDEKS